jgi:hypothetical protein
VDALWQQALSFADLHAKCGPRVDGKEPTQVAQSSIVESQLDGFSLPSACPALNGDHYDIIGVLAFNPAWLEWGPAPPSFVPAQLDPNSTDVGNYFQVFARLKPGVTLEPKDRDRHLFESAKPLRRTYTAPAAESSLTNHRDLLRIPSLTTIRMVGLFDERQQVVRNPIPVVAVGACGV